MPAEPDPGSGTGWSVCKKTTANVGDPGNPTAAGAAAIDLALDRIVEHPSTPDYLSTKLLQWFVTETPTPAMVASVVAAWNDAGDPQGIGDLRAVTREVLAQADLLNPDGAGDKIKNPFEQVARGFRATRGLTDGNRAVRAYLSCMQQLYFQNPIPTGYPELGSEWLDTNNLLERQNFAAQFSGSTHPDFGTAMIALLNDNGVSTGAGNENEIVDFLADVMFGGALTPAERQAALDFLTTDDNGVPSAYNNARIRDTARFMMGLAQFLEQ